jgi:uncharacterized protein
VPFAQRNAPQVGIFIILASFSQVGRRAGDDGSAGHIDIAGYLIHDDPKFALPNAIAGSLLIGESAITGMPRLFSQGNAMSQYIYLHGFASSPQSAKARDLSDRFAQLGISLTIPDLNQGDFTYLTLTRQLRQVEAEFPSEPNPVTLIGSSFGGLTAAWLGHTHSQVERLVLLAPAFGFLAHWLPRLGYEQVQQWQNEGFLPVYHYGEEEMLPISYTFAEDAALYRETDIQRPVPMLILHGKSDEVIPIQTSIEFAESRPWVTLIELESDHSLLDVSDRVWQEIQQFCEL